MANIGVPCSEARDALLGKGVTINGLVMLNDEPWVDGYYSENVVGGPGAGVDDNGTTLLGGRGRVGCIGRTGAASGEHGEGGGVG